ncbi:hypothetical protein [Haladaptatus sp. DFWS20]|uniref:hypothetical protein n=1 Tax=Haladaptatus sp. DFWS20 TaxID=3403467 RepID=UPI003EBAEA1B
MGKDDMGTLFRGLGILCFELGLMGLGATVIVPEPRAFLPALGLGALGYLFLKRA